MVLFPGLFVDASESAAYLVEVVLGRCFSGLITAWGPSDAFDQDDAAASLTDHPQMAVLFLIGLLVFLLLAPVSQAGRFLRGCGWGHVDGVCPDLDRACCKGFSSVPGPLQSVQKAEMWGSSLAVLSCSSSWC